MTTCFQFAFYTGSEDPAVRIFRPHAWVDDRERRPPLPSPVSSGHDLH